MSKYHNKKTVFDGITFDSESEARYYQKLKAMESEGQISDIKRQVAYQLLPDIYEEREIQLKTKTKVVRKRVQQGTKYIADFVYTDTATGKTKVVDVKGMRTPEYKLKKKMMRCLLGITIIEV